MLPHSWQTARLLVQDAVAVDRDVAHACLAESQDVASLDPAFALVPPEELEAHIQRSMAGAEAASRAFQMQLLRVAATGDVAGYWHFMAVPRKPSAVGVSILLIRPNHRRLGLGRELIAGALSRFDASKDEIWARVYLANLRALEFWSRLGLDRLALLGDTYVSPPADRPSIILSRPLDRRADAT